MILSRQSILQRRAMVYREDGIALAVEPVSVDVHLSEVLIDGVIHRDRVSLHPGIFALGSTFESFNMPNDVVGFVVGKSTLAREGLQIEAAGLMDPGFRGNITLELKNLHHQDWLTIRCGEPIGQVCFMLVDRPVDIPYGPGNHYQDQSGVMPSYRTRGES